MPCGPSLPEAHASGGENDGRGFDWRVLAALFLLALLVRIGSLWELSAVDPYFASPVVDEQTNLESALRIAGGKVRPDAPYWKPPLYPHLMALVVDPQRDDPGRLFGDEAFSPCRLKAIQAFIDSFTAVLVALLGGLAAGRAAGIAASILYSLAFSPVFFSAQLLDTTLFTFLAVLSLQQLVVAEREGSRLAWLWGGALLGLAADTRAVMLATIAAVALVAPIFLAGAPRRRLAYGALVVAGAALLILPVTLMNWRFGGDRVLISSNGGINFYIGNRRGDGYGADGLTSVHAGPRWRRLLELASDEDRASARSRRYYALAFEEIAADPAHFAGRILRKAHALLHAMYERVMKRGVKV
ncbi:MAG: hypothetical protein ACE5GW_13465, partial [Planctomycetota bacterium]